MMVLVNRPEVVTDLKTERAFRESAWVTRRVASGTGKCVWRMQGHGESAGSVDHDERLIMILALNPGKSGSVNSPTVSVLGLYLL